MSVLKISSRVQLMIVVKQAIGVEGPLVVEVPEGHTPGGAMDLEAGQLVKDRNAGWPIVVRAQVRHAELSSRRCDSCSGPLDVLSTDASKARSPECSGSAPPK